MESAIRCRACSPFAAPAPGSFGAPRRRRAAPAPAPAQHGCSPSDRSAAHLGRSCNPVCPPPHRFPPDGIEAPGARWVPSRCPHRVGDRRVEGHGWEPLPPAGAPQQRPVPSRPRPRCPQQPQAPPKAEGRRPWGATTPPSRWSPQRAPPFCRGPHGMRSCRALTPRPRRRRGRPARAGRAGGGRSR